MESLAVRASSCNSWTILFLRLYRFGNLDSLQLGNLVPIALPDLLSTSIVRTPGLYSGSILIAWRSNPETEGYIVPPDPTFM